MLTKVAPILLNNKVKAAILVIYATFTAICVYGVMEMKVYESVELNYDEDYLNYEFL